MEPACALIYSAPIEFSHRLAAEQATNFFDERCHLPTPPVHKRPPTGDQWRAEREGNEDGLDVMRKVVARRLEAREKTIDEIITRDALTLLARMSGGVMRELIRYFRDGATDAQLLDRLQIDESVAQGVILRHRQALAPQLNAIHREALRRVLREGTLTGGRDEPSEDELLRSLHLLSYQGDQRAFWYDAHPNVLPLL
ncbi:MAG: hypothetical protein L0229_28460 [Blastocatellia bacterium]|nr:hypothetical protein [Blastocatellia bacterium]